MTERRVRISLGSFAVVLIAAALVSWAAAPAAAISSKYLAVTHHEQNQTNWCWAAAAQTVVRFATGTAYTQCKLVDMGEAWRTGCPNIGGTRTDISNAVKWGTGHTPDWDAGSPSAATVTTEINANRPMIITIEYS